MGILRDIAFTGAGYGIRTLQDKRTDETTRIKRIQEMEIKEYIDEYIKAKNIVSNTAGMRLLASRLRELANYYEYVQ